MPSGDLKNSQSTSAIPTAPNAAGSPRIATFGAVALVFLGLCIVYFPAIRGEFLWDDVDNVTKPELYSWQGLHRIWFQWGATQTYYPLLHTLYWFEHKLWGEATLGYHLASLLFHSVSVCLVYWIVRRLKIPGALLAAALFAVHPIYVESLAWITEQKNTLSGMLFLGSMLAYLHFDEDRLAAHYALALALFVMSLMSKTSVVTLPVAMLVILWWKRGALSWRRDLAPLIPWFALSLLFGGFTAWYEKAYVGAEGGIFELTWLQRCLLAARAVWFYWSKFFWPANLTLIYPRWEVNPAMAWQYVCLVGLVALFAVAWLLRRRWRGPLAALLFFVGTIFPLLGFFSTYIFAYTYVCDHFQYLPSLGILVLVSAGITLALNRLPAAGRRIGQGVCLLVLGMLAYATWQQSWMYHDAVALYRATLDKNPACWMAYNNLGLEFERRRAFQKAIQQFRHAIRIHPAYARAHYNLANQLASLGNNEEAIAEFHEAIRLDPHYVEPYLNLGNLLLQLGRTSEAIEQLQTVIDLDPQSYEARYNLAAILAAAHRVPEAIVQYQNVLTLKPDFAEAHCNLAAVLLQVGRPQEAADQLEQALKSNPAAVTVRADLAKVYALINRPAEALAMAETALKLARLQQQPEMAQQIQSWLNSYRRTLSGNQGNSTAPESTSTPSFIPPGP